MSKLLDIYIIKKFFINFLFIIISFTIIFLVVDIIDHLDKFISRGITNNEMLNYYILTIPWFISIALPMTLLMSTIITFISLQKNNELTALKASGISIWRISLYLILIGFCFCFISFVFDNIIVTNAAQKKAPIEQKLKKKKIATSRKNNIYYHLDDAFLAIKRFNYKTNTAKQISIQNYIGPDINSRLDAKTMKWDDDNNLWILKDILIRKWVHGNLKFHTTKDTLLNIKDINPDIIKKDNIDPEDMDYWELSYFIKKLQNKGLNYTRWSVNKSFKTAFACIPIIMVLFGIALSIRKPRSNYSTGIGFGIVVIFMYYLFIKLGQTLGYNEILSPFLSVWFVNILFLSLGCYFFIKTRS
tara:strand:- start:244 stop:1320 length:1077 start_codon:yes stop_codon:yes gene_type:complete